MQRQESMISVRRDDYREMQRIIRSVARSIQCPDCGAAEGRYCKPEYGCTELWRAGRAVDNRP
jgi:hypothetical protein